MQFRKEQEDDFGLDMTPMIDVVFLLLIFFMVSTSFIDFSRRMDISLPEAEATITAKKLENYIIEIGLDKKIYFNEVEVTIESLKKMLNEKANNPKIEKSAVIRADGKLNYELIVKIMSLVNEAKITDLSIAVK